MNRDSVRGADGNIWCLFFDNLIAHQKGEILMSTSRTPGVLWFIAEHGQCNITFSEPEFSASK